MNDFRRTVSGLNNQHLFYDADYIVFVEGGRQSFSKQEAYSGSYHTETEDTIFWNNVFQIFRSEEKMKFKSIGSKSTLKEISDDILNERLKTVIVAMDSEFDELSNTKIEHPKIFYTYGYSYENDIWNINVIRSIIEEITAVPIQGYEINNFFKSFLNNIKLGVFADAYLFKKAASFFPRKSGYLFCVDVDCNVSHLPTIKKSEIHKKIQNHKLSKSTLYSYGRKNFINIQRFCFGHLLADYCCHLIISYIKRKHNLSGIRKEIIFRMGINKSFKFNLMDIQAYKYYEGQFINR